MAKIDILMATYNGEKYIRAQILSIISQSFLDWKLIIHDDGSSDSTLKVIESLCNIDQRITIINDGVVCGGAAQNFLHLTKYSSSEYVMFADQDDIWFDNKVELMYQEIASKNNDIPQVIYSNSYVWKDNVGIKGVATLFHAKKLKDFLFQNSGIQGCASIFNREMHNLISTWDGPISMHDHILQLFAITKGEMSVINLPLMLYRNHSNSVTNDTATTKYSMSRVLRNMHTSVIEINHYGVIKWYYAHYKSNLDRRDTKYIDAYLTLPNKNIIAKLLCVIRLRFTIFNSTFRLIAKVILRPFININTHTL